MRQTVRRKTTKVGRMKPGHGRMKPGHGTMKKGHGTIKKKGERVFKKSDFYSGDGMLTTVWGPPMWHYLHTMSFNYPVQPTPENKKHYRDFILNLRNTLPCKYCRQNLTNNLKTFPLTRAHMRSRDSFSRYIYHLHEMVNKMLGKTSGLTYCDVRERYEHFRSRCTSDQNRIFKISKDATLDKVSGQEPGKELGKEPGHGKELGHGQKKAKEKGCTEPLYSGKKAKCIMQIVPQEEKCETFHVNKECIKKPLD